MKLGFIKSTPSRTFTFTCDTRKYEPLFNITAVGHPHEYQNVNE